MRVYLPLTLPLVERLVLERSLEPTHGFAVTPGLLEWYSSGDTEELEYAATVLAARESLALLAADLSAPARRVVLAVDLADEAVVHTSDEGTDRGRVLIRGAVGWSSVAAALVDGAEAADEIAAARDAVDAASAGDEDAAFTVEAAEGHDLMWFATQELQYLSDGT